MAVHGGPKVAAPDGLVLALDGANLKSFKGEATENLQLPNISDWSNTAIISLLSELSPIKTPVYSVTDNNTGSYLSSTRNITVSNNSNTYTISVYIKKTFGATSARLGFNCGFTGGSPAVQLSPRFNSDTGVGSIGSSIDLGDWWRWQFQITNNNSGNTTLYCSFFSATGFYNSSDNSQATGTAIVSSFQIEQKSYVTTFTPTSRGTTVATGGGWADLTGNGNHGELVNGVRESSDNLGSLLFDGTNDYVETAILPYRFLTIGFTVSIVFRYTPTTANDNLISWGNNAFNGTIYAWEIRLRGNNGNIEFSPGIGAGGSGIPERLQYVSPFGWGSRIICIDVTFVANGLATLYENGVSRASRNYNGIGTSTQTNTVRIGRATDTNFPGNIYSVKIYNRALTAAEVQQNFNATRSRYGI